MRGRGGGASRVPRQDPDGVARTPCTCPPRPPPPGRRRRGLCAVGGPRDGAVQSVPDNSFPSTLLVSFSWRRTDSRGTPSRGTAPCDDWRPPCSPPPRWRPSITRTPAAAAPRAPPVPSFSAAARRRAAPCGRPTGATRPSPPATTDSCPRCSASRGPSCSRCGPASPTRPRPGPPPLLEGAGGGGGEQTETMVPSQDAIITLTRPVRPTVQYSPPALAPGTVPPAPTAPRGQPGGAGRGGAVCAVSGTGQGYLAGATVSPESGRNPASGPRGLLGPRRSGTGYPV